MRGIFAEAGLSAGVVHNYFRTKEELIEAGIVESTKENIDTIMHAAETMTFREIIELFLADLEAAAHDGRAEATPKIHAEVAIRISRRDIAALSMMASAAGVRGSGDHLDVADHSLACCQA